MSVTVTVTETRVEIPERERDEENKPTGEIDSFRWGVVLHVMFEGLEVSPVVNSGRLIVDIYREPGSTGTKP